MNESINLTKRDLTAVWKNQDGVEGIMADMSDAEVVKAVSIVQKRQIEAYNKLMFAEKLETQLIQECKNRNINTIEVLSPKREIVKSIFRSVKRKLKTLTNV